MSSTTSLRARRRAGALLCAAVLAGGALAASPAAAAPESNDRAGSSAVVPAPNRGMAASQADPNADGYDSFIVTYKETSANSTAKGRANAWGKAAKDAGVSVKELRETALGSRVISTDRKLTQDESAAFMADLRASGAVDAVEPNVIMTRAALSPVDQYYPEQWGFTGVNGMRVPGAWNATTGAGTIVGVIDTGQTNHADLNANIVPGYDFISSSTTARDGGGRDANPQDEGDWFLAGECGQPQGSDSSWHGTHVAGTIAAVANTQGVVGVAPNAKVQHARVLGKCGGSLADIADAIVWSAGGSVPGVPANATPVDVINMSLGGQGLCSSTYQNAINTAVGRGVPVVVAAGNENQPAANARPANCQNTITVAATDVNGNRASYSNYGSAVDVAAPGSGIISTVNAGTTTPTTGAYAKYNGTSMATPHVAGTVALMLAKNPALTPAQVESSLKANSRPIPGVCAEGCGAGLVDATKTLNAVGGGSTPTPPPPPPPPHPAGPTP
ncbi:S8 family peptidase, partial [Micrococcus sp.]|uniref:S8 family peptidase n=1 Tax=Micrococcus sp. TaxID=1271 RepID=UPI0026DB14D9